MALEDSLNYIANKEEEGGPRGQLEPHFQTRREMRAALVTW